MAISLFRVVLCIALLTGSLPSGGEPVSIDSLISQAEKLRSSDHKAFERTLSQLNRHVIGANANQRLKIEYLNAYQQVYTGKYDEGADRAKRLLKSAADTDLKFRAGVLIFNSYALNGRFSDGLRQMEQTLSFIDDVKDAELRQQGLLAAATLYDQLGQYQLARHYAESVIPEPTSGRNLCFAHYLEFDSLLHLHAMPADDAPLLDAVSQCQSQGEIMMANLIRGALARKWVAEGGSAKAQKYLQAHLGEVLSTGYPRLIAEIRSLLAQLMLAGNDLDGAAVNANAAIEQTPTLISTPPVVSAYRTLYQVAEQRHDLAAALSYYKRYADADRGYLNEVKTRELAYQIVRNENLQKGQQIELLNRKNNLLQLQQRVEQQKAENSRLLMLLFAVFTLVIAYWGYKTRRLHASLRRMAQTDALTGICNRHHFTAQSERTLAECAKDGEQVSLIMFDLDHFKVVNDSYGHVAGDWLLKEVAKTCSELCRRVDHFGRLGGEEFAILLEGCDARAATRIAEDCRVRIMRLNSAPSGHAFRITASFGVSCAMSSGYNLDKLISHADQMLYRAKREGRNRVKTYTHDVPMESREPAPWHGVASGGDAARQGSANA